MQQISLVLFLIVSFLCLNNRIAISSKETDKDIITYKVGVLFEGPNDTETKARMFLYNDSLGQIVDSIQLATCGMHDRQIPLYNFIKKDVLLFEDCSNRIKLYDVVNNIVLFEQQGFILSSNSNPSLHPVDTLNEKVLFFERASEARNKFFLNIVDTRTLDCQRIDSLISSGDAMSGSPYFFECNFKTREVIIKYETKDWKIEQKSIKY